jgi:short-subunit dehydrogenase
MSSSRSRPIALITGASSGIGATFAERLARDGYDLILVARRRDRLEALAARLRGEAGVEAQPLAADLADAQALSLVEAQVAGNERLVLLVNNAGFGGYRPFVEVEPKIIDELIAVHIRAVTRLTRAALPGMVRRGKGAVINIASLLALSGALPPNPLPYRAVYAGAKEFILAITEALSGELGQSGVHVQACLPGLVKTEYHAVAGRDLSKMPPMMEAADVVAASLAALSQNEVVCVPGLDDASLLERLAEVRRTVLMSANRPALSQRYRPSVETITAAAGERKSGSTGRPNIRSQLCTRWALG